MSKMSMTVQKSKSVFRCASYFGRVYVHLRGYDSSCTGDRAMKIMVTRDGTLTIAGAPVSVAPLSDTLAASLTAFRLELEAAGARQVPDAAASSTQATYKF